MLTPEELILIDDSRYQRVSKSRVYEEEDKNFWNFAPIGRVGVTMSRVGLS